MKRWALVNTGSLFNRRMRHHNSSLGCGNACEVAEATTGQRHVVVIDLLHKGEGQQMGQMAGHC